MRASTLVFVGIGAILLVLAAVFYFGEQNFLSKAETATGTVTDFELSTDTDNDTIYCPVIEFSTKSGQAVRYDSSACSAPPAYRVGNHVQVIYDPKNLRSVQVQDFWQQYLGPIIFGLTGLPFVIFGLWGLLSNRSKA